MVNIECFIETEEEDDWLVDEVHVGHLPKVSFRSNKFYYDSSKKLGRLNNDVKIKTT
jgi:hypothetical protein